MSPARAAGHGDGRTGRRAVRPPTGIVREAPAKLNLTLAVIRQRADRYHALHSVIVPLSLADTISVAPVEASSGRSPGELDSLAVSGFEVPGGGDNLVLRAIALARAAVATTWPGAPALPPPLAAKLVKRIPVAAGLGGGSSDAACALDAALEAWDATLDFDRAMAVAAALGSDVSFFLAGGTARISGRGEFVDPLPDLVGKQPAVLLVTPAVAVPTREVFQAFSRGAKPVVAEAAQEISERLAADMTAGLPSAALLARAADLACSNDLLLASVAVVPPLLPFRRTLARLLGCPVGQSGSGPTCWALYPSLVAARKAAQVVEQAAADGTLPPIGHGPPFVAVATILRRPVADATIPGAGATMGTGAAKPPKTGTSRTVDAEGGAGSHNVRDAGSTQPFGQSVGQSIEQDGR